MRDQEIWEICEIRRSERTDKSRYLKFKKSKRSIVAFMSTENSDVMWVGSGGAKVSKLNCGAKKSVFVCFIWRLPLCSEDSVIFTFFQN